jgi:hypothetical protein
MKLPLIKHLAPLIKNIKRSISDDCRAFSDDEIPGIQLTVGWNNETGEWDFQTGYNSYSGGAYFYPHWAVVGVYRRSNSNELARDIQNQLADLADWQ